MAQLKDTVVSGNLRVTDTVIADNIKTSNGTSSGFLKADGSIDTNTYALSSSVPSAVTETTVSGWGFTKNAGTITGITMNGASKGTSGVVNLGTVITSETGLSKGTTTGSGNAVTDITVSGHQITLSKDSTFLTSETSLSKGTSTGSGNAVTDISVSGHQITLTKGSTFLTSHAAHKLTATNGTATSASGTITYVESLTGTTTATSGDLSVTANRKTVTIPSAPGTLNTTATTAQSTSSSEALSGSITLHKVAKTGTYSDLIGTPTIPAAPGTLITNATTAQTASSGQAMSGSITLHKIAKTGTYSDLIGKPTVPTPTSGNAGKIPVINSSGNGWDYATPSAIYSGSGTPSNGTGNNGDVYLQTN